MHVGVDTSLKLVQSTVAANTAVTGSLGPAVSGIGGGVLLGGTPARFAALATSGSIYWLNTAGATPAATPLDRLLSQIDTEEPVDPMMPPPPYAFVDFCNVEGSDDPMTSLPIGWNMFPRFDDDPEFVSPATRNYRLGPNSPSIDVLVSSANLADTEDADRDGDLAEDLPPLSGTDRELGADVDHGAFEYVSCSADIDRDGEIGFADLLILLANYGQVPGQIHATGGDVNGDGNVGFPDLLVILTVWGPCGAPSGGAPESVTDCIEKVGTSDPQVLAACIEAMLRLEAGE